MLAELINYGSLSQNKNTIMDEMGDTTNGYMVAYLIAENSEKTESTAIAAQKRTRVLLGDCNDMIKLQQISWFVSRKSILLDGDGDAIVFKVTAKSDMNLNQNEEFAVLSKQLLTSVTTQVHPSLAPTDRDEIIQRTGVKIQCNNGQYKVTGLLFQIEWFNKLAIAAIKTARSRNTEIEQTSGYVAAKPETKSSNVSLTGKPSDALPRPEDSEIEQSTPSKCDKNIRPKTEDTSMGVDLSNISMNTSSNGKDDNATNMLTHDMPDVRVKQNVYQQAHATLTTTRKGTSLANSGQNNIPDTQVNSDNSKVHSSPNKIVPCSSASSDIPTNNADKSKVNTSPTAQAQNLAIEPDIADSYVKIEHKKGTNTQKDPTKTKVKYPERTAAFQHGPAAKPKMQGESISNIKAFGNTYTFWVSFSQAMYLQRSLLNDLSPQVSVMVEGNDDAYKITIESDSAKTSEETNLQLIRNLENITSDCIPVNITESLLFSVKKQAPIFESLYDEHRIIVEYNEEMKKLYIIGPDTKIEKMRQCHEALIEKLQLLPQVEIGSVYMINPELLLPAGKSPPHAHVLTSTISLHIYEYMMKFFGKDISDLLKNFKVKIKPSGRDDGCICLEGDAQTMIYNAHDALAHKIQEAEVFSLLVPPANIGNIVKKEKIEAHYDVLLFEKPEFDSVKMIEVVGTLKTLRSFNTDICNSKIDLDVSKNKPKLTCHPEQSFEVKRATEHPRAPINRHSDIPRSQNSDISLPQLRHSDIPPTKPRSNETISAYNVGDKLRIEIQVGDATACKVDALMADDPTQKATGSVKHTKDRASGKHYIHVPVLKWDDFPVKEVFFYELFHATYNTLEAAGSHRCRSIVIPAIGYNTVEESREVASYAIHDAILHYSRKQQAKGTLTKIYIVDYNKNVLTRISKLFNVPGNGKMYYVMFNEADYKTALSTASRPPRQRTGRPPRGHKTKRWYSIFDGFLWRKS